MMDLLLIRHDNIAPVGSYPLVSCLSDNPYLLAGPISYSVLMDCFGERIQIIWIGIGEYLEIYQIYQ